MNSFHHKETSDEYLHILCQLNSRWRVIRYRHDLQWIIQKRSSPNLNKGHWVGKSYHASKNSVVTACLGVTGLHNDIIEAMLDENLTSHCSEQNSLKTNAK